MCHNLEYLQLHGVVQLMRMSLLLLRSVLMLGVASLLAWLPSGLGHANGAPPQACLTMQPGHLGHRAQPLASAVHKLEFAPYKTGNMVLVKLASSDKEPFKGFFIQARSITSGDANPVGQFSVNNEMAKTVGCGGHDHVAVTHSNNSLKEAVSVLWKPPNKDVKVVFVASVVKEFTTFWVGIQSLTLVVTDNQHTSTSLSPLLNVSSTSNSLPPGPLKFDSSNKEERGNKLNVSSSVAVGNRSSDNMSNNEDTKELKTDNEVNKGNKASHLGETLLIANNHFVIRSFVLSPTLAIMIVVNRLCC